MKAPPQWVYGPEKDDELEEAREIIDDQREIIARLTAELETCRRSASELQGDCIYYSGECDRARKDQVHLIAQFRRVSAELAAYRDAVGKELIRLGCPEEGANQFLRDVDRVVSARAALSAPEDKA